MQTERRRRFREMCRLDEKELAASTFEVARRYVADFPKSGPGWRIYGLVLAELARYPEALAAMRRAMRLCPPESLHWVYGAFGNLHRNRGAFRLAERWYRRAIEHCPSEATFYIFLGGLLASSGRLSEAEEMHRRATLCKEGRIDEAFLNLGYVLRAQEQYPAARQCFQRALELDPKYKGAKKALADMDCLSALRLPAPKRSPRSRAGR